jgi:hypothetical protein
VFDDSSPLVELAGKINIIYTGAFFQVFNFDQQETIAARIVQLLVPQPASVIIRQQSGSETAGDYSRASDTSRRKHFRHNPESWQELWDGVGEKTGSIWSVKANLRSPGFTLSPTAGNAVTTGNQIGLKGLRFTIERL